MLNTETKRKTPMTVYIKGDERLFGDSAVTRVNIEICFCYAENHGLNVDNYMVCSN